MGKSVFLLLVLVAVVSQAHSQSLSARPGPQQRQGRRPNGPRLAQGTLVRAATSGARKSSGAKANAKPSIKPNSQPNIKPNAIPAAKLSTKQGAKAQLRIPKLKTGKAQLPATGFPKAKCEGRCNFPVEVCVKKARCTGQSCFFCAETKSLPKIVEKKPKPSPTPTSMNFGFDSMGMNNLGMLGMQQQQQPTDFFSDIFGLGPSSGGGFDIFGGLFGGGGSGGMGGGSGGLFGGGSGGMGGGSGMNFLSMSMLGMDPFQLF